MYMSGVHLNFKKKVLHIINTTTLSVQSNWEILKDY